MQNEVIKTIYIDACALCRPFDDQSFLRIKLETIAMDLIINQVRTNKYNMKYSSAHLIEIEDIPDVIEQAEVKSLLVLLGRPVFSVSDKTAAGRRTEILIKNKFGVADAAHAAFAERCADAFISCDDDLIRKCRLNQLGVWCGTPVEFCQKEALQ
jgi:predicted nucleic acid-binding protein